MKEIPMMNVKQFERLQAAVQWTVDEARFKASHRRRGEGMIAHVQSSWAIGRLTGRRKKVKGLAAKYAVVCPTSCCLAGNIVAMAGEELVVPDGLTDANVVVNVEDCIDADGRVRTIPDRAAELTGLTTEDANLLFNGSITAAQIRLHAADIAARSGHTLEVF
jgi:hypothetical protein